MYPSIRLITANLANLSKRRHGDDRFGSRNRFTVMRSFHKFWPMYFALAEVNAAE
jgi:hypothetical protein